MNTKFAINKTIQDIWQNFVEFLFKDFDISVLVH